MKSKYLYFLILTLWVACDTVHPDKPSSTAIALVPDFTESKKLWPAVNELLPLFDLTNNPDAEAWLRISPVTNLKTNPEFSAHLPSRMTTDSLNTTDEPQFRNRCIVQFYKNSREAFAEMYQQFDSTKSLGYSECFSTISAQLRWLVSVPAKIKRMYVYSDVVEKGSFGNAYTAIAKDNISILREKFENAHLLPERLDNITVVFVFQPRTRLEEMRFEIMTQLYRTILEARGAKMQLQSSSNPYAL